MKFCEGRELPKELSKNYLKKHHKRIFETLQYSPLGLDSFQTLPDIIGFDTETYQNGDLLTLCDSEGHIIEFNKGEYDLEKVFNFFIPHLQKKKIFFAWNLGFDATILLKNLGKDIIYLKEFEYDYIWKGYKIKYIPKKCLVISDKSKHSLLMYDVASLFNKLPLDDASKKFLKDEKRYDGLYQNKKFPDDIRKNKREMDLINLYCIHDAYLTKQLALYWVNNFYNAFGMYPKKYHSAGTIAIQYLKTKLFDWNSFFKIPYSVQELAFKTYFGGRFEVFKRGTFSNVFHYDINSAYPYAMANMPDFTRGHWVKLNNSDFDKKLLKHIGFYSIKTTVNEKFISPFLYRPIAKSNIYAPYGKFQTFTTNNELKIALEKYEIDLHDINGYYFVADERKDTNFNKIIKEMYKQRLNQKDEGQKQIYRIIINSLYGKTAQTKPVPTSFFSPVVCSYITGKCRAMLLEAVSKTKDKTIAFATDAVFSESPIKVKVSKEKILGDWSFEFHRDFTIFMSGIYSFSYYDHEDKKAWLRKTRSRGFKINCIRDDGTKYKLDLESSDIIEDRKNNKYFIKIKYLLPNTISASVNSNKIGIEKIGKFDEKEKELDINGDRKRLWFESMKTLNAQQSSSCLNVSLL